MKLVNTETRLQHFLSQIMFIIQVRQPMVANIGLTSWGTSRLRNLMAFLSLSIRATFGRPTVILLHSVIEVVDPKGAGYELGPIAKKIAHWAVSGLKRAKIGVFSREISSVLTANYHISAARCAPLPCDTPDGLAQAHLVPPAVVSFGFLSPYKGVEVLLEAWEIVQGDAQLLIVGKRHALLSSDANYQRYVRRVESSAERVKARFLGFVSDPELMPLLKQCSFGVLVYTSTTGASASFTQLATAGVPVIASDLPEFRYIEEEGAGVILTSLNPKDIASKIQSLLGDLDQVSKLAEMQLSYASRHTWSDLCGWIEDANQSGGSASRPAVDAAG